MKTTLSSLLGLAFQWVIDQFLRTSFAKTLLATAFLLVGVSGFGQTTTLAQWTFPSTSADASVDVFTSTPNNSSKILSQNRDATCGQTLVAIDYSQTGSGAAPDKCALAKNWSTGSFCKYWMVDVNTTGYSSIKVSSKQRGSNTGPKNFKIQYKVGSSGTWTDVTGGTITVADDNFVTGVISNLALPTNAENSSQVFIRWIMTTNTAISGTLGDAGTSRIDDILITGVPNGFSVTYDGNNNTGGTVPTDNTSYNPNDLVTVLGNTGNLVRTNYTFDKWNTSPNGTGSAYSAGDTFNITANTTLYARWKGNVTYNANGGTGTVTDGNNYSPNDPVTTQANSFTYSGFNFTGWNTQADGLGVDYAESTANAFNFAGNITLYAKWTSEYNITFANLQFPGTQTITEGGTFDVYGQVYAAGLTDADPSAAGANIFAEVGYSATDNNPSSAGWTWATATYVDDQGNNDNYKATIGTGIAPGTYYYATRFKIGASGTWVYGGFNLNTPTAGGVWNGTANKSGVLTVDPDVVDFANFQFPATGTIVLGGNHIVYGQVYEPGVTPGAGQGAGITAEVGYSLNNNTNPNTWTNWLSTSYNSGQTGNNDEYMRNIGPDLLTAGTYYLAFRYKKTGSSTYIYGGTNGIWNNDNATVTVQNPQEINIKQGTTSIATAGTYAFGNQVSETSGTAVTFTVENLGDVNLSLGALSIFGTNASEFTITQPVDTNVAGDGTTTFTVTFSPTSAGAKTAAISLANDDGNEDPYVINLTGTGNPTNDLCSGAINLVVNDPDINGTLANATASPSPFTGTSKDVWYKFTPNCDGKFTIDLTGTAGRVNIWLYDACGKTTSLSNTTTNGNVKSLTSNALTNGTTYYVRIVADDAAGETSFKIKVNNQITIVTPPADTTVNQGNTAAFSSSIPANQTARQWQVLTTASGAVWTDISGATATVYTTPSTTMAMNGYRYRVVIKNGTCVTVESNSALLTVKPQTTSTDMFRSQKSGDWDVAGTWISSSDGGATWLNPATAKPTGSATSIEIMDTHTVKTWGSEGAKDLTVHSGATLDLNASLTNSGVFKIEDNGTVNIKYTSSNLSTNLWAGTEDFAPNSLVRVTVMAGSGANLFTVSAGVPAIAARTYNGYTALFGFLELLPTSGWSAFLPSGADYNLTHNDLTLTYGTNSNLSMFSGGSGIVGIGRNFITNINTNNSVAFQANAGSSTLNINQNYIKKGTGTFTFTNTSTAGNVLTYNIEGDFLVESGIVRMHGVSAGSVSYNLNLKGNLIVLAGQIFNNNTSGYLNSNFNFTGTNQTISYSNTATAPTSMIFNVKNGYTTLKDYNFNLGTNSKFTVESGATLDFGFNGTTALDLLTGSGTGQKFELKDGGTLKITSPDGITTGGTYAGNVQVGSSTTNRVYGTAGFYHYIGKGTQQVSGNGLPAAAGDKKVIVELENDNVKFWATPQSGAGSVKRFSQNGWLEIRRGTVLDGQNPDVPSENYGRFADAIDTSANTSQSANLKMTGGRYVLYHSGYAMPHFSGTYDLTGGVIQFDGNEQSIRAPKTYLTVEVTGKKVGTPDGNITLKSISSPSAIDGSLTVKNGGEFLINNNSIVGETGNQTVTVESGGIFNTGDSDGFSNSNQTSIQLTIENINLLDNSTVEYSRAGAQTITVQSNVGQGTANYANLNISGSGIKAPADNLEVNDKITVNAGELKIKSTQDNITSTDHHVPNVLWAHKGIINNGGIVTLENNAQLMQDDSGVTNSGMVNVQRKNTIPSSTFAQYVYWSSPVVPASNEVDKFFTKIFPGYTAAATYYSETNDHFYASSGKYIVGRGLAVKNPVYGTPPSPNFVMAELKGTPFNGPATFSMTMTGRGFNLVGNPYPTNLSLQELYLLNGGDATATSEGGTIDPTFHLWDNVNNPDDVQEGSAYGGASYAIFNAKGTGTFTPANSSIKTFDGAVVSIGQGFMVKAIKADNKILTFNNTVRKPEKGIFFKSAVSNIDLGKYWLRLTNASSGFSTIAVTYSQGASNALESFDSKVANRGGDMFYSYVDDNKLAIQGRAYDFTTSDVVPLGMAHSQEGNYTISVWKKQGIFDGQQKIYLRDKNLGTVTDISAESYNFQSTSGEFTNRFEIVYEPQTTLGTTGATKGDIVVYRDGNDFVIKSSRVNIQGVELYEVSGKLTRGLHGNAKELRFPTSKLANGVYILKIRLENGSVVTRKIIQ